MTSAPSPAQGDSVLLVDDNPTNLQILMGTLRGRDYRLLVAKSGRDALHIARKARPALILLDIMMPGMDGYQVCQELKTDPGTRDTAVIFLSALGETSDKVKGLTMGAVDYITKPFQPEEVIARVDTHLTIHRLKARLKQRNRELEAANERMSKDLEAAARVQKALLPAELPELGEFRCAWSLRPCDELAGDSLNLFNFDGRHLGLYVLDVSGHGVPSALLSVAVTRSLSPSSDRASLVTEHRDIPERFSIVPPAEVARRLNAAYPMDSRARLYFTLVYGVLDIHSGHLRLVNAGHPGPVLARPDRAPESFAASGVPIGLLPESDYAEIDIRLQPGDRLYLYSDGLYEERNEQGECYGLERLRGAILRRLEMPLQDSVQALIDDICAWRGSCPLRDDITVLALERQSRADPGLP
jgi:sigma-B regulation protein RsbU (phosphoserine phosphatase)